MVFVHTLTDLLKYREECMRFQVKGNPVKFRNGPAAVTGDENCLMSLFMAKTFCY